MAKVNNDGLDLFSRGEALPAAWGKSDSTDLDQFHRDEAFPFGVQSLIHYQANTDEISESVAKTASTVVLRSVSVPISGAVAASRAAPVADADSISASVRPHAETHHVNAADTISEAIAKPVHAARSLADGDPISALATRGSFAISNTDQISNALGTVLRHRYQNTVPISDSAVPNVFLQGMLSEILEISNEIHYPAIRNLVGTASFGIDMAGNDQMIPDELASFFMDEGSGLVALNDVSSHTGSYVGGVQIGQPEVFGPGGKKLLSGASILLDGSTGHVDISSALPDIANRTTATFYSYFKVATVASASTLMEVADDAHATASSIDFTTFLSAIAYPNRPLAPDNGDPFDHTELAGYQNANADIDGSNGQLVLTATHDAMTDYLAASRTYTSGMVQTGGNVPADMDITFQYAFGHLEIDFKLAFLGGPSGIAGLKPVFRLTPRNANQFPYPPEIDILQMFGSNSMVSQVHLGDFVGDNHPLYENSYTKTLDPTSGFHTVSMDWDASHIEFFLDGTSLGSYVGRDVARVPMFLSISLGIGGATTVAPNPSDFASGGAELRIARILVEQ